MTLEEEFLVWEPGRCLVFQVTHTSLPLCRRFAEVYDLSPTPEGHTALAWRIAYEPTPWLRLLHPLLRPLFARDFAVAEERLTEVVRQRFGRLEFLPQTA
jgi:hypothetical protein